MWTSECHMSHPWDRDPALTLVYHTSGAPVHREEQGWAHQAFRGHAHVMCMTMIVDGLDHTLGVGVAAGKKEWLTVAGKRATWQNHMVSQVADASGVSAIGVA